MARDRGSPLTWLSVGAVAAAAVLSAIGSEAFRPYFGPIPPVPGVVLVVLVGVMALTWLRDRDWFEIHRSGAGRGHLVVAFALGILLPAPMIVVDVLGGFPRDINAPLPDALLFYPTIALVAETVFHAVPLALLLILLGRLTGSVPREQIRWVAVVLASAVEPIFQVVAAPAASPAWATGAVGIHLAVFNVVALALFVRFDFLTALLLRASYYLVWHILWGAARLDVLF